MFKSKFFHLCSSTVFFLLIAGSAFGTTYYIRPDGGTAAQCSGKVDSPYSTENAPHCAWNHYYEALPPTEYSTPPRIQGGDTLIIKKGTYKHGPGDYYNGRGCIGAAKYQCSPKPVPSGPDPDHPTRILGEGWDNGCSSPPTLWGSEKIRGVLDLTNSSNVEIQCLEITDHESCGVNYKGTPTSLNCDYYKNDITYGNYALAGIYSGTNSEPYNTSSNILLKNLYIHGLASTGIKASHIKDWVLSDLNISKNAKAGFDGDVPPSKGENDKFSGTMTFKNVEIGWSGCIEDWETGDILKCYDQQEGGYGDGIGTGPAGNATWIFENVAVHHNTSDGIDLLYLRSEKGSYVKMKNMHIEGNAGNGIKVAAPLWIENSELIGNCDYWYDKPFSENIIRCRGGGAVLTVDLAYDAVNYVINNSFTGEAPAIIGLTSQPTADFNKSYIYFINNLLQALPRYNQPDTPSDWMYIWNMPEENLINNYWLVYKAGQMSRYGLCETSGTICNQDPKLVKLDHIDEIYDLRIASPDSQAIGKGMEAGTLLGHWGKNNEEVRIPIVDKDGNPRSGRTCFGAYEWIGNSENSIKLEIQKIIKRDF